MIDDDLRTEFKFFKEHLLSKGFCYGKVGGDGQPSNNDVFHYFQCKKWIQCIGLLIEIKMVKFLQTAICERLFSWHTPKSKQHNEQAWGVHFLIFA